MGKLFAFALATLAFFNSAVSQVPVMRNPLPTPPNVNPGSFLVRDCPFTPQGKDESLAIEAIVTTLKQIASDNDLAQSCPDALRSANDAFQRASAVQGNHSTLSQVLGQYGRPVDSSSVTFGTGVVVGEERADSFKVNCDNYQIAFQYEYENYVEFSNQKFFWSKPYSAIQTNVDYFQCFETSGTDESCLRRIYEFKVDRKRRQCSGYSNDLSALSSKMALSNYIQILGQDLDNLAHALESPNCPAQAKTVVRSAIRNGVSTAATILGVAFPNPSITMAIGVAGSLLAKFIRIGANDAAAYKRTNIERVNFENHACVYLEAQNAAHRCQDLRVVAEAKPPESFGNLWWNYIARGGPGTSLNDFDELIIQMRAATKIENLIGSRVASENLGGKLALLDLLDQQMTREIVLPVPTNGIRQIRFRDHLASVVDFLSKKSQELTPSERNSVRYLSKFLKSYDVWKSAKLEDDTFQLQDLLLQIRGGRKFTALDSAKDDKAPDLLYLSTDFRPAILKYWKDLGQVEVFSQTASAIETYERQIRAFTNSKRDISLTRSGEADLQLAFNQYHKTVRKEIQTKLAQTYAAARASILHIAPLFEGPVAMNSELYVRRAAEFRGTILPLIHLCTLNTSAFYLDKSDNRTSPIQDLNLNPRDFEEYCSPLFCREHGFVPYTTARNLAGQLEFSRYQCSLSDTGQSIIPEKIGRELAGNGTICGYKLADRFSPTRLKDKDDLYQEFLLGSRKTEPTEARQNPRAKSPTNIITGSFLMSQILNEVTATKKLEELKVLLKNESRLQAIVRAPYVARVEGESGTYTAIVYRTVSPTFNYLGDKDFSRGQEILKTLVGLKISKIGPAKVEALVN